MKINKISLIKKLGREIRILKEMSEITDLNIGFIKGMEKALNIIKNESSDSP
jgi:hypothetical protein